jgi:hypothetical protein
VPCDALARSRAGLAATQRLLGGPLLVAELGQATTRSHDPFLVECTQPRTTERSFVALSTGASTAPGRNCCVSSKAQAHPQRTAMPPPRPHRLSSS